MRRPDDQGLRPKCRSDMRLRWWLPLRGAGTRERTPRVMDVMLNGWALSTRKTYGAGLAAFHNFCDGLHPPVPESERAPAAQELVLEFISSCAGTYSMSACKNYVSGLAAWHTLSALRAWA